MTCRCHGSTVYGDTGDEAVYLPWTGPQMASVTTPLPPRWGARERPPPPVVLNLLSRRELTFDGRANSIASVPLPAFGTAAFGTWVLSVAVSIKTDYLPGNQLKVWIQNVHTDEDNPAVVFAGDGPSVTVTGSPAAPHLVTSSTTSTLGPQARLLMQWTQGGSTFSPPTLPAARTVLSAWLTLRPKSKPPVT